MPLRLVFMGTPHFAVPTLNRIVGGGHQVVAVYARPPSPAKRGKKVQLSPVEIEARRFGIKVLTPQTLKTPQAQEAFHTHEADAAVVVAYGLILPKPVLDAPRLGCFNLHASALPRWRGAAPINRAIMDGDTETAVMAMKMDEGLDTGPIATAERVAIGPDMTAGELEYRLARPGADLMLRMLVELERGSLQLMQQCDAPVTYAAKIDKKETRIDWSRPWKVVHDHCRGLSPFPEPWSTYPGAWFELPRAGRIKVLRTTQGEGSGEPGTVLDAHLTIACGTGAVRILELQRASGRPMKTKEFLNGTPVAAGTRLA
jgi:methionyl-tRNA formyltransferase